MVTGVERASLDLSILCYYGLKGRDKHYFVFIHFSTNPEETEKVTLTSFYAASDNMQRLRKTQKVNVHLTLACSSLNPSEDGDKLKVFCQHAGNNKQKLQQQIKS